MLFSRLGQQLTSHFASSSPVNATAFASPIPELIAIPGGSFLRGSMVFEETQPVKSIHVSDVLLGKNPVTNEEHRRFTVETRSRWVAIDLLSSNGLAEVKGWGRSREEVVEEVLSQFAGMPQRIAHGQFRRGSIPDLYFYDSPLFRGGLAVFPIRDHNSPQHFDRPKQPVVEVNWFEALAYSDWYVRSLVKNGILSADKKWVGRLPTEAEWEKAAKGPEDFDYATWNNRTESGRWIWKRKEGHFDEKSTCDVDDPRYKDGPYGLRHMLGNVWDWCMDWYDEKAYELEGTRNPVGPIEGRYKSVRGGSWYGAGPGDLRAVYRNGSRADFRVNCFGFRVAVAP